jgi:hypothetical protein
MSVTNVPGQRHNLSMVQPAAQLTRAQQDRLFNAVSVFAHTRFCGTVKLFRLLYLLDVLHLQGVGATVTGETYRAYRFGPGPDHLYSMIEERYGRTRLDQVVSSRADESIDTFGRILRPTQLRPVQDSFTPHQVEITNGLFNRYREAHWAEIELTDNGAYDAAWEHGRGHGRVIDLQQAISPADANAAYALERYREDQKRAHALRTLFGNAA